MKRAAFFFTVLFTLSSICFASFVINNASINNISYRDVNVYVSATGSGLKDGSSPSNAWEGFSNVVWGPRLGQAGVKSNLYVCGTIRSALTFTHSGVNSNLPLVIRGDCPDNPGIINGAWIVTTAWTLVSNGVYSTPVAPGTGPYHSNDAGDPHGIVTEDDTALVDVPWNTDSGTTIATMVSIGNGSWSYDNTNGILYVLTLSADDPTSHTVEVSYGQTYSNQIYMANQSFVTFKYLTVKNAADYGVNISGGTDNTIDNCRIYNIGNWGVFALSVTNMVVSNSVLHHVVWQEHTPYPRNLGLGEGIRYQATTNGSIYNNEIHSTPGIGIDLYGGTTGVSVYGNVIHDNIGTTLNYSSGIYSDDSQGNLIYGNLIYNEIVGISLSGEATNSKTTGTYVYNNVVYNWYYTGFYFGGGQAWVASENNFAYNNTFVVGASGYTYNQALAVVNSSNDTFKNNIVFGEVYSDISHQTLGSGYFDYNQYLNTSFTGSYSTSDAWKTATAGETHSGFYSPSMGSVFVNAPTLNFSLVSNSSPIGNGVNLSSVFTIDYAGSMRPSDGAWDVGAYENS